MRLKLKPLVQFVLVFLLFGMVSAGIRTIANNPDAEITITATPTSLLGDKYVQMLSTPERFVVVSITPANTPTNTPTPVPKERTVDGQTAEEACGKSKDGPIYITLVPKSGLKDSYCASFEDVDGVLRMYFDIDKRKPNRGPNWNEYEAHILFPYTVYARDYVIFGNADDYCEVLIEGKPEEILYKKEFELSSSGTTDNFTIQKDIKGHIYMFCSSYEGAGWFDISIGISDPAVVE